MNKRMLMIVFALVLAFTVGSVVQANVLWNSSFEDVSAGVGPPALPLNYWYLADRGGTGMFSTDQAHTGDYSAKIVGGVPNSMKQDQGSRGGVKIALDPLATYSQSVWVYLTALADPILGTQIYFRAGWGLNGYDAGATYMVTEANKWVQVVDTRTFTGNTECSMWSVRAFSGNDAVYFDDAVLAPEPSSIVGLLTGGLGMLGFAIRRRKA
ncbi:MAG: carbohydrate binding domain-containing protein [Armatimonadetes bacterium]|nr:carbohydrate binding domain-containing protein [Armatimonadota bacterium]